MRRTQWQKIKIADTAYESAGVFDVNNDGKPDIVCGGYWYENPGWNPHRICTVRAEGEYFDDFSTIPMDIDGDGYLDFVTGGWWGQTLVWRQNPGPNGGEWTTHEIYNTGSIETTRAWDVDNDGDLEIVPNTPGNPLAYYKLKRDANGKPMGGFDRIVVSEQPQGHGLGFGDINNDGRGCLITPSGYYAPPATPGEAWTFHPEWQIAGALSVPMLVADVNGDGVNEMIVGQGHNYGLSWYEPVTDGAGTRSWVEHPIDPWFSQYHDMIWIDIDGDGQCELITGNRHRAHCGHEPGEDDIVGLYIFKWNGESFTKQVVDYGPVPRHSGTGIYMAVADVNADGRLDIIAPGKEGLYLFINLGPETVGA